MGYSLSTLGYVAACVAFAVLVKILVPFHWCVKLSEKSLLVERLQLAYDNLRLAREGGDQLTIDLAEEGVNNILDQLYRLSHVTTEEAP